MASVPPRSRAASLGAAADEARVVAIALAACLGTFAGLRWPERSTLPAIVVVLGVAFAVFAGIGLALASVTGRLGVRWPSGPTRGTVVAVTMVVAVGCGRGGTVARGYEPMETGPLRAEAVVRGDPEPIGAGWRAELQLQSGERLDATAFGRAGFDLRQAAVGDRVEVEGRVRPVGERPWLRARHIVGRLSMADVTITAPASGFDAIVNRLRAVIVDGAVSFDERSRSLYTGLVIGDDRFQPLAQQAQFRASGLTHLLAVSGQNVAFVLLVVRPLLMLFSRRVRLLVVVGVLVVFAAMTRAEPSVLRAATAAGVATWALITGRTGSGLRTLAAGVTGLVLVDPFLIDVVGFQLSVAASAGIIVVAPLIVTRLPPLGLGLPGTTALGQALAVTVGAQVGVAPLLIHHFGPLPLASIPANLLAGWAAGAVMTLGLTVGPISGLLQQARLPQAAASLQWPSRLLVEWIDGVARWTAGLGLPRLGIASLGTLVVLGFVIALRPRHRVVDRSVIAAALMAALTMVATGSGPAPSRPTMLASGVLHIPGGTSGNGGVSALVINDPPPSAVDAVLASGVGPVDVFITARGDARTARLVDALTDVVGTGFVYAPPQHRIRGATRITEPFVLDTGWGSVTVEPDTAGSRLIVALPPELLSAKSTSHPGDR